MDSEPGVVFANPSMVTLLSLSYHLAITLFTYSHILVRTVLQIKCVCVFSCHLPLAPNHNQLVCSFSFVDIFVLKVVLKKFHVLMNTNTRHRREVTQNVLTFLLIFKFTHFFVFAFSGCKTVVCTSPVLTLYFIAEGVLRFLVLYK